MTPLEFEEVVPHDDGMHTYISLKFPLLGTEDIASGVCGISTDITDVIGAIAGAIVGAWICLKWMALFINHWE